MSAQHEITVRVVSPEEADYGVAEFWLGDEMVGFTYLEEGELLLSIQPRSDGSAVLVNARSLAKALTNAKTKLEAY